MSTVARARMADVVGKARLGDGLVTLEARQWDQHTNRSIISPTALAFLIPVLVVFIFAPFLCVFCIRRRRQDQPVRRPRPAKIPALERSEARERLKSVVEVSNLAGVSKAACIDHNEEKAAPDSASELEKECAICLSTLHAPSPPESAKLSDKSSIVDETTLAPPKSGTEQEELLRLKECGHEFHAECLISWVVLHKKSCPICRTVYYHEEAEKATDIEAQTQENGTREPNAAETVTSALPVSNWHYFWTGRETRQQNAQPDVR